MRDRTIACLLFVLPSISCSPHHPGTPMMNAKDAGTLDANEQAMAGFAPDVQPTGPRLWIDAKLTDPHHVDVDVWAAELGPTFGYVAHVRFDTGHLHPAPDAAPPSSPVALAPDDPSKAIELWTEASGDVGIGAVRTRPENQEIMLVEPTLLGTLKLEAARAGHSVLGLDRVSVRRVDSAFVPVETAGGVLTTTEGGAS
jgi:hypothetical protein